MNNFTLVVPTHNRHKYLARSIRFFKNLDADVIYCDSTIEKYSGTLYQNMTYLHLPDKKFHEKILIAVKNLKTDNIALCADDDFILLSSLIKGSRFLGENKSYKTVIGNNVLFYENFTGNFFYERKISFQTLTYSKNKNAIKYFKSYSQILWRMYNKKIVEIAFRIIEKSKFSNDNFIELVLGAVACYYGGIKVIPGYWSVREVNESDHWGHKHKSINIIINDPEYKNDFDTFFSLVDEVTQKGYARSVLNSYLFFSRKIKIISYLKSGIKKVSKFIISTKKNTNNSENQDYQKYPEELLLIRSIILEHTRNK